VRLPYRGAKDQLNLLIDSTGIKAEGKGALSAECLAIACRVRNGTPASMAVDAQRYLGRTLWCGGVDTTAEAASPC